MKMDFGFPSPRLMLEWLPPARRGSVPGSWYSQGRRFSSGSALRRSSARQPEDCCWRQNGAWTEGVPSTFSPEVVRGMKHPWNRPLYPPPNVPLDSRQFCEASVAADDHAVLIVLHLRGDVGSLEIGLSGFTPLVGGIETCSLQQAFMSAELASLVVLKAGTLSPLEISASAKFRTYSGPWQTLGFPTGHLLVSSAIPFGESRRVRDGDRRTGALRGA